MRRCFAVNGFEVVEIEAQRSDVTIIVGSIMPQPHEVVKLCCRPSEARNIAAALLAAADEVEGQEG